MLKIDELKVSYGGIEAVKGITFEVPERQIVTLIGANGAGKSTTLRTIAGLVKPAHGRIHLQGEDITGLSPDRIVSKGVTLVPEGRRVFPDLSVVESEDRGLSAEGRPGRRPELGVRSVSPAEGALLAGGGHPVRR